MSQTDRDFKVTLVYRENHPTAGGKRFSIDYFIAADTSAAAVGAAVRQFESYQNHNFASWIRTILREETKAVARVRGRYLDEFERSEIADLLDHGSLQDRMLALHSLRFLRDHVLDPDLSPRILAHLDADDLALRFAAMEALRSSGDAALIEPVMARLGSEAAPLVRASLISMMGQSKDAAFIPFLLENLLHPDDRVRANAVDSLEQFGEVSVVPRLLPLIEDENHRVRANVIRALWSLEKLGRTENLDRMISSDNPLMRAAAAHAQGEMRLPGAVDRLVPMLWDRESVVRRNVLSALRRLKAGEAVIEPLLMHLADPDREVRRLLFEFILEIGFRAAIPVARTRVDPDRADEANELLDILCALALARGEWFLYARLLVLRHIGF